MTKVTLSHEVEISTNGDYSNKNCKPVICVDTGVVYSSCREAANAFNVNCGNMSECCNGKRQHTVKGMHFCYVEDLPKNLDIIAESIQSKANIINKYKDLIESAEREQAIKSKIDEYRSMINKLQTHIVKANEEYTALKQRQNNIIADISGMDNEIANYESEIAKLNQQL